MKDKKTLIRNLLLRYGVIIGVFWIFKYLFLIGSGFSDRVFIYVYYILNIGTFLLIYVYYFKFRNISQNLWQCVKMIAFVCFVGSLIEGGIMLAHYSLIHPDYFDEKVVFFPKMLLKTMTGNDNNPMLLAIVESKSFYIILNILGKVLLGIFLTLAIGLLSGNKKIKE